MAAKVFWVLNTAAASPFFGGSLQEDGSAPTAANSSFGWTIGVVELPYWRARLGASAAATVFASSSYIDGSSGPTKGTGATNTTAGDAFRTPSPLTGTFASGTWTFDLNIRTTAGGGSGLTGGFRLRVFKSANADGSSATLISPSTTIDFDVVGLPTVNTDVNCQGFWNTAPTAIALTNEYLFFQLEWKNNVAGNSGSNVLFRVGTAKITTTNFIPPTITGSGAPQEANKDTASASGTVTWPVISGSGSPQETTSDTAAGTGTVVWSTVTGSGAPQEGADTALAGGTVLWPAITGSGAAVEGPDTASGAGTVAWPQITGAGAAIEGPDTASGAGTGVDVITGSGAAIDGADTAAGSGTVVWPTITGAGAATEGADTALAGGAVTWPIITGSGAAVDGTDTAAGAGTVFLADITGSGNAIEGADTAFGAGIVTGEVPIPPEPQPVPPSPGGVGGRPLYRRIPLKKRRKREEELPPEVVEVIIPIPPQPPLIAGLPQAPPIPALALKRGAAVIEVDEEDDEIALLLEVL